ncbi:hypothetical protein L2E82_47740 [Cichorium intybus]|uniref:Uncharacterized protein n=1 Tax=Cichorium intybus TaxID=13427 RepID=A0ACB8YWK1_CICIN|nr:hypothetical protein L2E82_47740 [Cichorium intybus]
MSNNALALILRILMLTVTAAETMEVALSENRGWGHGRGGEGEVVVLNWRRVKQWIRKFGSSWDFEASPKVIFGDVSLCIKYALN